MKFKQGDRVRWINGKNYYGTVLQVVAGRSILVFWDDQGKEEDLDLYEERELDFVEEANDILKDMVK